MRHSPVNFRILQVVKRHMGNRNDSSGQRNNQSAPRAKGKKIHQYCQARQKKRRPKSILPIFSWYGLAAGAEML